MNIPTPKFRGAGGNSDDLPEFSLATYSRSEASKKLGPVVEVKGKKFVLEPLPVMPKPFVPKPKEKAPRKPRKPRKNPRGKRPENVSAAAYTVARKTGTVAEVMKCSQEIPKGTMIKVKRR